MKIAWSSRLINSWFISWHGFKRANTLIFAINNLSDWSERWLLKFTSRYWAWSNEIKSTPWHHRPKGHCEQWRSFSLNHPLNFFEQRWAIINCEQTACFCVQNETEQKKFRYTMAVRYKRWAVAISNDQMCSWPCFFLRGPGDSEIESWACVLHDNSINQRWRLSCLGFVGIFLFTDVFKPAEPEEEWSFLPEGITINYCHTWKRFYSPKCGRQEIELYTCRERTPICQSPPRINMDLNKVTSYSAAMFDRIKSAAKNATVTAVSATVNAVGAVGSLIGNPLTKDFDVGKHVASFGPNLAWKIYEGKKRTTGQVRIW